MKIEFLKNQFNADVKLPASKSESNRLLILKALASNNLEIVNLSNAEDTSVLNSLLFDSVIKNYYDVGHAGTAMRFLTAYLSLISGKTSILTGSARMQKRPIRVLVDALRSIGAEISYLNEEGFPPIQIHGKNLAGGKIEIDSTISSQYLSALLMIAPKLINGLELNLIGQPVSLPYLNMTINLMEYLGGEVNKCGNTYKIPSSNYSFKAVKVESDWSSASYWYQIAAFSDSCKIALLGLKKESLQGDSELVSIYEKFGVATKWNNEGIVISKSKKVDDTLEYFFELENTPDLAQTIICTCAGLGIKAKFTGLSTLKIKETDRLLALQTELSKFNVKLNLIGVGEAELLNETKIRQPNLPISTYDDHRMAMSFAPLALIVGNVEIENPEVVKKSYPNYWSDLEKVFNVVI